MNDNLTKRQPLFAKKSLGQNFLADAAIVKKIADAARLDSGNTVIEIGPGRGALTESLIDKAGKVIAIEIDPHLANILRVKFVDRANFEVIQADVLTCDLPTLVGDRKIKLVANLPYYISTAVLQLLIKQRETFADMILMFQREVVDRIVAKPGNSERGYLTVMVEAFLNVDKLFDVPPSAFNPVPKVWSAVIRSTPKADDPLIAGKEVRFERLVSSSFRQKRKTISNNLKAAASELNIVDPNILLEKSCIDPKRRAETLTIEEWKTLFANYVS